MSFMSISLALLLSTLFAFTWSANARKDSGDYWKGVMKNEPMPIALEALILSNNVVSTRSKSTTVKKPVDCGEEHHHHATDSIGEEAKKLSTMRDDFQPRPSATPYVNKMSTTTSMRDDFEHRPSVTAYVNKIGNDEEMTEKPYMKSFEPRPNVSSYHDGDTTVVVVVEEKPNMDVAESSSFEPRPNVSAYRG